jgi:hypothetical protein
MLERVDRVRLVIKDRQAAARTFDPSRFSPIASERFGYLGTLAMFNPKDRLDRIEISQ